jgi:hypothetical protein
MCFNPRSERINFGALASFAGRGLEGLISAADELGPDPAAKLIRERLQDKGNSSDLNTEGVLRC